MSTAERAAVRDAIVEDEPTDHAPASPAALAWTSDALAHDRYIVLRATVLFVIALLAALGDGTPWFVVVAAAAYALVVPVLQRPTLRRIDGERRNTTAAAFSTIDLVVTLAAAAASGHEDSPVMLLLPLLPLVGASALPTVWCFVLGGFTAVGCVVLGLAGSMFPGLVAVALWALAFACTSRRGGDRRRRRLARLDALHRAVLTQRPVAAMRARLVEDLQRDVAPLLAAGPEGDDDLNAEPGLQALRDRLRTAAARIRGLANDLDAGVGGARALGETCRMIAERHAPQARVRVGVPNAVDPDATMPIAFALRGALGLTVCPRATALDVWVDAVPRGLRVVVRAEQDPGGPEDREPAAWERFVGRSAVRGIDVTRRTDGEATVVEIRFRDVDAPVPPAPPRRERGPMIALRLGFPPVAAVVILAGSGTDTSSGFLPAAIAFCVWAVASIPFLLRSPRPAVVVAVAVVDVGGILGCLALSGDLRTAFVPVGALTMASIPILYHRALLVPIAITGLAVTTILGGVPAPATQVVLLWALFAGATDHLLRVRIRRMDREALAHRTTVLHDAAGVEERERRQAAHDLHDDLLQVVLVAQQDVADAIDDEPGAAEHVPAALAAGREALERAVERLSRAGDDASPAG